MDYPGKVITKNQVTPTQTSATGVWTLDDAAAAVKNNNWPVAGVPNPISKSLRFNSADSAYLNRTFGSGDQQKFTLSLWVKRSETGARSIFTCGSSGSSYVQFRFNSGDTLYLVSENPSLVMQLETTQVFRDYSAWYHIVLAVDTTQATSSNRVKLYVNGSQITAFSTASYPAQNTNLLINSSIAHYLGTVSYSTGSNLYGGYFTEINFIDGQALTPSSFGMTDPQTGAWEPIRYTGTYGTNGFYLNFKDATSTTTLGYDYSGNANNWTTNNFSVTAGAGNDSLTDVPTPWIAYNATGDVGGVVRGNYCTANAVDLGSVAAPTNGNLAQTLSGTNGTGASGTFTVTTGKWYWEVTSNATSNAAQYVGVIRGALPSTAGPTTNPSGFYYGASGNNREDGTTVTYGNSWANLGVDYVIGVALDCDANTVVFYVNNVSQGTRNLPSTTSGWKPQLGFNSASGSAVMNYNFGQRPFAYTPPAGFLSLCTTNLPNPTIGTLAGSQAGNFFNANLYTGTGSAFTLTGVGFQPDFGWFKGRNASSNHWFHDVVRGANPGLSSNNTLAEDTTAGQLTAFASDGYSLPNDTAGYLNFSGRTMVVWSWKAGGTGVTNTAGTITSTVSANTTSGCSIVTYTGTGANATVGHGLGVAPSLVIVKRRDGGSGYSWHVQHVSTGNTRALFLDSTSSGGTSSVYWNNTSPTSTVVSVGTDTSINANTGTFVMYAFAPIAGYSAFGSYTGNGSTDGPFVYLGFRPRWLLIKMSSSTENWYLFDAARDPSNDVDLWLLPNGSNAETSFSFGDFVSNGFKIRATTGSYNASGGTYIYAAFAEFPFKFANAR